MMTIRNAILIVLILGFSTSANSISAAGACPHAPRPRLSIGATAVVGNGTRRLNLRALPAVDTGVEKLLNAGSTLTVLTGPSCNGGYNWWRVETAKGDRGWVAEGDWEAYFVVPVSDGAQVISPVDWSCPRLSLSPWRCQLP
jgi:hypothetical protein